jgi:aminoacrylate hydrolase
MPLMRISDGELFYEVYGSGPPLITAAGLGGVGSFWTPQLEAWSEHFQVIVHDHRGTGQSSRDAITYSVPQMARDVVSLAEGLGIDRFHFAGHSTGASIGQELGLHNKDRVLSLVLASGWAKPDPWFTRCFATRERLLLMAGPEVYVRAQALFIFPPWWVSAHDDRLRTMEETQLKHFPSTEIVSSRIAAITSYGPGEALNRIERPTLVTCADDDHLTPPHFSLDMHRLMPGSDLAILPTGGHFNNVTRPDDFNAVVLEWLLAQKEKRRWNPPAFTKTSSVHHA